MNVCQCKYHDNRALKLIGKNKLMTIDYYLKSTPKNKAQNNEIKTMKTKIMITIIINPMTKMQQNIMVKL